jgi:hypothetical protein
MSRNIAKGNPVTLVAALALTLASASASYASDLCISYFAGPLLTINTIVGKGFRVPAPGKCRPFAGERTQGSYGAGVASGTACTASDGTVMHLVLITSSISYIQNSTVRMDVSLPLGGGATLDEEYNDSSLVLVSSPMATVCPAQTLP